MSHQPHRWFKNIKPGDGVRIKGGPFAGREGVVLKCDKGSYSPQDEPVVLWISVEVRAFGGKAMINFHDPDAVEHIPPVML